MRPWPSALAAAAALRRCDHRRGMRACLQDCVQMNLFSTSSPSLLHFLLPFCKARTSQFWRCRCPPRTVCLAGCTSSAPPGGHLALHQDVPIALSHRTPFWNGQKATSSLRRRQCSQQACGALALAREANCPPSDSSQHRGGRLVKREATWERTRAQWRRAATSLSPSRQRRPITVSQRQRRRPWNQRRRQPPARLKRPRSAALQGLMRRQCLALPSSRRQEQRE